MELILRFEESADGGYQAQVYGSSSYQKGILYEDLTRLEEVETASCRRARRRGGLSRWCQEIDLIRETTAGTTISCSPEGIQEFDPLTRFVLVFTQELPSGLEAQHHRYSADRRLMDHCERLEAGAAAAACEWCRCRCWPVGVRCHLRPRVFRQPPDTAGWRHFLSQVGHLQWVALALMIWAAWAWSDRTSGAARFTALQIGCGLFACLLQWFGNGVYGNAEFDLIIAVAIGLGVAIARIETSWLARRIGNGPARDVVIILLIIRLVSSGRQESAQVLFEPAFRASLVAATQRQADLAARVAAMPGLVMCWNANLVCRQAGKTFVVDDFKTDQLLATGAFTAPELGQMLRDRKITIFTDGSTSPFALPQASPTDPQKAKAVSE